MNTIIINDQLMEQMCAASDRLVRARAEYDARLKETGSSHFSDTAALLRRQLRLDVLLKDLERHLARFERFNLRSDAPLSIASSYSRRTDLLH